MISNLTMTRQIASLADMLRGKTIESRHVHQIPNVREPSLRTTWCINLNIPCIIVADVIFEFAIHLRAIVISPYIAIIDIKNMCCPPQQRVTLMSSKGLNITS